MIFIWQCTDSLLCFKFFFCRLLFENVKKTGGGGTSVKPLAACEGMLWGKPHITCPQKIFEKIRSAKNRKILNSDFCPKNGSDRPNFIPGGAGNGF